MNKDNAKYFDNGLLFSTERSALLLHLFLIPYVKIIPRNWFENLLHLGALS